MADCGIDILVQQGTQALVRVTCAQCKDENLLKIVFQSDAGIEAPTPREPLFHEEHPVDAEPIGTDELIDVHSALDGWRGDVRELVGSSSS